jgi:hypothetical protein
MTLSRDETVRRISTVLPELRRRGVIAAWLFGSVARGTASEASDVDVVVEFAEPDRVSLWDLGGVYAEISDVTGRDVSLLERHEIAERPEFEANFVRDAIRIL